MRDLISLAVAVMIFATASTERALARDPNASKPTVDPVWKCGGADNKLVKRFYANNVLLEDRAIDVPAPLQSKPAQGDVNLHLSNALQLLKKDRMFKAFS
jgi:hypothetical protein